jgi:uncharacterized membrane protein
MKGTGLEEKGTYTMVESAAIKGLICMMTMTGIIWRTRLLIVFRKSL